MKAYIFVETGEVRSPRYLEAFIDGGFAINTQGFGSSHGYPILRRIEVEVPTKAEAQKANESCDEAVQFGFDDGVQWLASKLGLTID